MAAVDVADHVGIGFQHHVLVDQAGAGNRRTPVWMVLWMPFLRAHPTILRAVGPS